MPMIWRFVDRPELAATVLLDMNDGMSWKTLGDEFFKLPSPPLERSIASNNLTDGGLLTNTTAGLRELQFTLELTAPTEAGRIAQVDALKRELAKPANLLMYQPAKGSFPVFFQTIRSDVYELNNQFVPDVAWRVPVTVTAQPYAIGLRHDIVSGVVVNNDPAAASNPTRLDITGVRGDSPAPMLARLSAAGGFAGFSVFEVAQRSRGNPSALTTFVQAESGTLGTDTTVQAGDADMSGGGSFVRCSFATNNSLVTRLTVTAPTATSGEELRGRYRVYARVKRASSAAFVLRFRTGGTSFSNGPLTTWGTNMANLWLLDLGLVDLPSVGPVPQSIGYSGLGAAFTSLTLVIQAQRISGSANLDIDYVYLLPADETQCSVQQVATVGSVIVDGPKDTVYGMAAGSSPFDPLVANRTIDNGTGLFPRRGGLPVLVPGQTNRLYVLRTDQLITATSTWDVSYWPRWREVATS